MRIDPSQVKGILRLIARDLTEMVLLMGSGPSGWAVIYPLVGDYVDENWHFDIIPKIMALLKHLYPVTHFLMPSATCPPAHFGRKVTRQRHTVSSLSDSPTYLSILGCHFDHVQWLAYINHLLLNLLLDSVV